MLKKQSENLEFQSPKYWTYFLEMFSHLLRKLNFTVSLVEENGNYIMKTDGKNIFYSKNSIYKYFQTVPECKIHWIIAGLIGHEVAHILLSDFNFSDLSTIENKGLYKKIDNIIEDGRVEKIALQKLYKGRCQQSLVYLREATKKINEKIESDFKGNEFLKLLLYYVRELDYPVDKEDISDEVLEAFNEITSFVQIGIETIDLVTRGEVVKKVYDTYLKYFKEEDANEFNEVSSIIIGMSDLNRESRDQLREILDKIGNCVISQNANFDDADEEEIIKLKKEIKKDVDLTKQINAKNKRILKSIEEENYNTISTNLRELELCENSFQLIDRNLIERTANNAVKQIQEILTDSIVSEFRKDFFGQKFNARKSFDTSLKYFDRKAREKHVIDIAVILRIDISGSMFGQKIKSAKQGALVLYDVCKKLNIPVGVYADTADIDKKNSFDLYTVVELSNYNSNDAKRIESLKADNNNRDDMALDFVTRKFNEVNARKKVCFILSDGVPASMNTHTDVMINNMQKIMTQGERKQGITYIPIGLGMCAESIKSIYKGKNFINVDDIQSFPIKLRKILEREILE